MKVGARFLPVRTISSTSVVSITRAGTTHDDTLVVGAEEAVTETGTGFADLFFGMERSGNNGTTAFDFEFNRNAPVSTYVPSRSVGDVLFTFEMSHP